jgi:hypothetical protein
MTSLRMTCRVWLAMAVALTPALASTVLAAPPATDGLVLVVAQPSALLTIDQNRTTVVDRIVSDWGEAISNSGVGLTADQLREILAGLRADHLLAASLAGTPTGLRDVIANALTATAPAKPGLLHTKALGDTSADLVYTPVVPCRIVDTRSGGGGVFLPGNQRNWLAFNPGGFASQGGSATNCGIPARPVGVMLNTTLANTVGGPEFFTLWPFNQARPNASTVNWWASGQQPANAEIVPLCTGGGCMADFSAYAAGQTDAIIDVLGYFKPAVNATTGAFEVALNGNLALRIQPDATSPILIAGSSANTVTAGASGAVIGGGGAPGTLVPGLASCGSTCANVVTDAFGTVGGGTGNLAGNAAGTATDAPFATVGGGLGNTASGYISTVAGGNTNTASTAWSTVAGGEQNGASGLASTVGGGQNNTASGTQSTVAGGGHNNASGDLNSTVAGGNSNTASGEYSTVGGGSNNSASGFASTISGGGANNTAIGDSSTVAGGQQNNAMGGHSTVAGGGFNTASGLASTVGGGTTHTASGAYSTVSGGVANIAPSLYSIIAGGNSNTASGEASTVGGGTNNTASGFASTVVGGGPANTASGFYSTVAGGNDNTASGESSFAAGRQAKTQTPGASPTVHNGAFVWADDNTLDFNSTADNEFSARVTGGVRFVTAINGSGAPTWVCGVSGGSGGSWGCSSDRNLKAGLVSLDGVATLERLATLPVYRWFAKDDARKTPHAGPMAQDFMAAFGLGDNDRMIGFADAQGVAFAAIQGLHRQLIHKSREIAMLKAKVAEVDTLKRKLEAIEAKLGL